MKEISLFMERPTLEEALAVCFKEVRGHEDMYGLRLRMAVQQLERTWGLHKGEQEYRSWFRETA